MLTDLGQRRRIEGRPSGAELANLEQFRAAIHRSPKPRKIKRGDSRCDSEHSSLESRAAGNRSDGCAQAPRGLTRAQRLSALPSCRRLPGHRCFARFF
jgi:hypothetical protein